jgi:hypothetical protein
MCHQAAHYSSPVVVNGMVYVGSFDGKLYAFGLPRRAPFTPVQEPLGDRRRPVCEPGPVSSEIALDAT